MTGKIKKRRGKGDSICAWEMNVEDEEKAKGGEVCVCVWRERLKEAVTERSEVV